jgi:hypothetical protein
MTRKSPHGLRPITLGWERFILSRALRSLRPTHPAVPAIVRRLNDPQRSPSPLHPHEQTRPITARRSIRPIWRAPTSWSRPCSR